MEAAEHMVRNPFMVGDVIHGFARGHFGRDSYVCRRVEAVGVDWIVTRGQGGVELASGLNELFSIYEVMGDRGYCHDWCSAGGDDG